MKKEGKQKEVQRQENGRIGQPTMRPKEYEK